MRGILLFATHRQPAEKLADWRTWIVRGSGELAHWQTPLALPGRLAERTFARNALATRDGRIVVPFQHYERSDSNFEHPLCGVMASADGGKTWTVHGGVRIGPVHRRFDWEESNLVELDGDRMVMLMRASGLMGICYRAESTDGGRRWPRVAQLHRAPSLGSATFYSLGGNVVAMIHNPGSKLALWISFDGMQSWPYQRVLARTSTVGPKDGMRFPHGFVSADKAWLHFAFVDSKRNAVRYSAKLPPLK